MFNSRVKPQVFNVEVLKTTNVISGSVGFDKLGENWKGLFRVLKVIRPESYKLAKLDG